VRNAAGAVAKHKPFLNAFVIKIIAYKVTVKKLMTN